MLHTPTNETLILCTSAEDLAVVQGAGPANVRLLDEAVGIFSNDTIVVCRGDGLDTLRACNLGLTGRVLDLGHDGSLASWARGRGDLLAAISNSAVDLFWHEERPISEFEFPKLKDGTPCGVDGLAPFLRWTDQGELVVVVGPYGCGKSSLTRLFGYHWLSAIGMESGKRLSICAWEDRGQTIKEEVRRYVLGQAAHSDVKTDRQAHDVAQFETWVGWTQRHPDEARLLDWYIDLVEHRARRDNVGFFIFDPWNEHDIIRKKDQTETEYVREMMVRLQSLAARLKVIIVVVTHIAAKGYDEAGNVKPFRVANAYGSSNFGAKATRGICMLRTKSLADESSLNAEEHMVIRFDKSKHEETMGSLGTVAMRFTPRLMSLTFDSGATRKVRRMWP